MIVSPTGPSKMATPAPPCVVAQACASSCVAQALGSSTAAGRPVRGSIATLSVVPLRTSGFNGCPNRLADERRQRRPSISRVHLSNLLLLEKAVSACPARRSTVFAELFWSRKYPSRRAPPWRRRPYNPFTSISTTVGRWIQSLGPILMVGNRPASIMVSIQVVDLLQILAGLPPSSAEFLLARRFG